MGPVSTLLHDELIYDPACRQEVLSNDILCRQPRGCPHGSTGDVRCAVFVSNDSFGVAFTPQRFRSKFATDVPQKTDVCTHS